TCPVCSYLSPYHSPQCFHNQNKSLPINQPKPNDDPQKVAEFNRLNRLLKDSSDLATLEENYRAVKGSSLYSDKFFVRTGEGGYSENKNVLDTLYNTQ